MKIALVQLCSFGDCLYVTLVARQIKRDYPGCHLTWVIGDKYASILDGNPRIDAIHKVVVSGVGGALSTGWQQASSWVADGLQSGSLDKAFYTQIIPHNVALYDGLIRSTTYRGYGRPIRGPHRPEVYLSVDEVQRVAEFVARNEIDRFRNVFLFECGPQSGQSPMTPVRAEKIANEVAAARDDTCFILSSPTSLAKPTRQVIDGSILTYRENAALSHYCTGLLGCSSGVTWLTTSMAGKPLPMLQLLTSDPTMLKFASVARDFDRFGGEPAAVIEMADAADSRIIDCINVWITESHTIARARFHEFLKLQKSHAENAYVQIRSLKGRKVAMKALCRFVWTNGISTVPWKVVARELSAAIRASFMTRVRSVLLRGLGTAAYERLRCAVKDRNRESDTAQTPE